MRKKTGGIGRWTGEHRDGPIGRRRKQGFEAPATEPRNCRLYGRVRVFWTCVGSKGRSLKHMSDELSNYSNELAYPLLYTEREKGERLNFAWQGMSTHAFGEDGGIVGMPIGPKIDPDLLLEGLSQARTGDSIISGARRDQLDLWVIDREKEHDRG
ncbi:hypothetical protein B0H17DRAFT_1124069 [Mycena rosella]|uniref:Uncharacterized protein n=1 Tax=Mycena rosella TaxID=1033263 RepID=A0AAD7H0W5_MYCRO|nr:hypothetical protein B0H17DRAFT_1124069 [Mycena rosella]